MGSKDLANEDYRLINFLFLISHSSNIVNKLFVINIHASLSVLINQKKLLFNSIDFYVLHLMKV